MSKISRTILGWQEVSGRAGGGRVSIGGAGELVDSGLWAVGKEQVDWWTGGVTGVPPVRLSIGATRQDPPLSQNIDSLMWDRSVFPIFLAALAAQWQPRSRYFIERSNSKLQVTN